MRKNRIRYLKRYRRIIYVILSLISVAGIIYIITFILGSDKDSIYDKENIISVSDDGEFRIFSENDKLGVKNNDDKIIIEAEWNNIQFLDSERFIVEKAAGNKTATVNGIIDSDNNCIAPFIYKQFECVGNKFLIGSYTDSDGLALFDTSGNVISNKVWNSYQYDENTDCIQLEDDGGKYGYKYDNGVMKLVSAYMSKDMSDFILTYNTADLKVTENVTFEKMTKIFSSSCIYFNSVLSGSNEGLSEITNQKLSESISSSNLFADCRIKEITNVRIDSSENEADSYIFSAEISYDYEGTGQSIENLKSLVSLKYVNDDDSSLVLKSINKEEI